nr:hypothetical protein [Tanacetum cinerariifolium]
MTHPHSNRHVVPTAVLTRSRLVPLNAARPVTTVVPQTTVKSPKSIKHLVNKAHSPLRRPINHIPALKNLLDHVSKLTSASMTLKQFDYTDALGKSKNPKGVKITCKGKIKTCKLGFDDGYFVKDLKFNLFSVSQMCDKKNSVLFTDTKCVVLSFNFKLPELLVHNESQGSGPKWLFDIDTLTHFMNYQPVVARNQPNPSAGIKENLNAGKVGKETVSAQQYMLLPLWSTGSKDPQNTDADVAFDVKENENEVHVSPSSSNQPKKHDEKNTDVDAAFANKENESEVHVSSSSSDKTMKHDDKAKREAKRKSPVKFSIGVRDLSDEFEELSVNSTNKSNAASAPVTAVGPNSTNNTNSYSVAGPFNTVVSPYFEIGGKSSFVDLFQYPDDPNMPALEDIIYSDDEEDVGAEAGFSNLETSITVSPILTTRVYKDHPVTQIIEEPKRVHQALKDPSWIEAIQEELLQFKMQKVWVLIDLPKVRDLRDEFEIFCFNSTNRVNAASTPVTAIGPNPTNNSNNFNAASPSDNAVSPKSEIGRKSSFVDPSQYPDDLDMPALEDIVYSDDEEDVGPEANFSNLETNISISLIPTTRVDKDHPVSQIIAELTTAPQTRSMGYTQEEGIDYKEVFAPVAMVEAIWLFLAYASFMGFMVVKALYGLHQAPRAWYETLANYLLENGFRRGKIDQTLFIKKQKGDILLVQVYVDDIIFGSTNKELYGKSASTPIDIEKPLLKDPDGEDVDVHLYRSMIGSLMYLTSSRPDIMFTVCACARFQVTPKVSHLHVVKRIFSDYVRASLDRKSITGGYQFLVRIDGQPSIYVLCIKQFWDSVLVKKTNYVVKLQALIDKKKMVVTEDTIRQDLRLNDADGVECLPNEEIFAYPSKFLMYPRFLQAMINAQVDDLSSHTTKYTSHALIQKVFANMRRIGKGFSGVEIPLLYTMLVQPQANAENEDANEVHVAPTSPSPTNEPLPPPQASPATSPSPPQAQHATSPLLPQP